MTYYLRAPPKRRRKGLTDYRKRLKLVKSGLPRFVVRKTNRYIIVQITESKAGGDKVLTTIVSKKLSDYGWKGSYKNTPAAYLTGYLAGKIALEKGVKKAIADIGLHRPVVGSRVFAAIKGAIDAGLEIPAGEDVFPAEERIKGEHIKEYFLMLSESGQQSGDGGVQFSKCDPEFYSKLPEMFEQVRERIEEKFGGADSE